MPPSGLPEDRSLIHINISKKRNGGKTRGELPLPWGLFAYLPTDNGSHVAQANLLEFLVLLPLLQWWVTGV